MSAISAGVAWAVGGANPPLAVRWNGTKWIRTAPHTDWVLESVAAVRPGDAWAVGFRGEPDTGQPVYTLIRHWDGRRWEYVPSPNPQLENRLFRVSAVNTHDVWALGDTVGRSGFGPLIAHFDGTRWTRVRFPTAPGDDQFAFSGLAAVSATDVWLAGDYDDATTGARTVLTAHWDGARWTLIPGPAPENTSTIFQVQSISALSSTDAWAVGYAWIVPRGSGRGQLRTLTLHWDGTTWSRVVSPNQASRWAELSDVSAVSTNDVWAVGRYKLSRGRSLTLTLHWNGTSWSAVPSPNPGFSYLFAVSAASSTDVWAVGRFGKTTSPGTYGLALHWNGRRWRQFPTPTTLGA